VTPGNFTTKKNGWVFIGCLPEEEARYSKKPHVAAAKNWKALDERIAERKKGPSQEQKNFDSKNKKWGFHGRSAVQKNEDPGHTATNTV